MGNNEIYTHDTYLSPLTWRYGTPAMRRIWSEVNKRRLWRQIWVALAEAQQEVGLVREEQVADLREHMNGVDIARAHEIEAEIRHDLMAEVHTYAEQAKIGAGIIHLGATSMDIEDNADALRLRDALNLTIGKTEHLLGVLVEQAEQWADTPTMAFTHIQPAEPTTIGYRLAQYAQDLMMDLQVLRDVRHRLRGKGFKGAVGSSASYTQLLKDRGLSARDLEARIMSTLELDSFEAATQTYPRKQDWFIVNALTSVAGTLYKFAFDLRLLQAPPFGEWAEPFGKKQIGSSAMPFKRNPITAEKMDSLGRYVATLPNVVWHNAAHSLLERTLDDSANRRIVLPQAFLAVDELLRVGTRLIRGLHIREHVVQRNLDTYGPFAATERLLMEAVKAGANRQEFHELIRRHSLVAWDAISQGQANPLLDNLTTDPQVTQYIPTEQGRLLMDASDYVGDTPERTRNIIHAATNARWGQVLLIDKVLYIAHGNTLRAIDPDSNHELMRQTMSLGNIQIMIPTPDKKGLIIQLGLFYESRHNSNVLRLNLQGQEEWQATLPLAIKEWGAECISSEGDALMIHARGLRELVALDWQTGEIV